MKRLILMAAMAVAAMGPGRSTDAPAPTPRAERARPMSPEEAAPSHARPAAQLRVLAAGDVSPGEFLWQARPLVVFADTAADPAFVEQLSRLRRDPGPLMARDVVVVTDTDPAAGGEWRRMLRPEGFSLVLIDKDGQVKQRKPSPWTVREISRAIDKFPLRRQEIGRAGVAP